MDAALAAWLAPRLEEARALGPEVSAVAGAVADLATRGGKRLRGALIAAAYEASGGEGGAERIVPALVAMELLQAYLLTHDDWMDEDETRRGAPTVHALLRERFGSAKDGGVGAVLAGDLAAGWALEAFAETPVPHDRIAAAVRVLGRIEVTVVLGQILDVRGGAPLERMHDLKTGSYTVRGPLLIGATLAGASTDVLKGLEAFARPLGIAFQLRDDLLGTFGDAAVTGKGVGGDLRQGKRTAVVAEIVDEAAAAPLLSRVLGNPEASAADVAALVEHLTTSGARARVEARLAALLAEARAALGAMTALTGEGRALLAGAVDALGDRQT